MARADLRLSSALFAFQPKRLSCPSHNAEPTNASHEFSQMPGYFFKKEFVPAVYGVADFGD